MSLTGTWYGRAEATRGMSVEVIVRARTTGEPVPVLRSST
jgi:hypothetical protein